MGGDAEYEDGEEEWPGMFGGLDDEEEATSAAPDPCGSVQPPYAEGPLAGVTPAQVEACVAVLRAIRADTKAFAAQGSQKGDSATPAQHAAKKAPWADDCRSLRKELMPLVERLSSNLYAGRSPDQYKGDRWQRKQERGKDAQARAMDARRINGTRLRNARLLALQKLQEQPGGHVPLIPDGAVAEDAAVGGALADGAAAAAHGGWAAYYGGAAPDGKGQGLVEDVSDDRLQAGPEPEPEPEVEAEVSAEEELAFDRSCYTCKARYRLLHHFYDQLCPACANLNWRKRTQSASLAGRVALVTGGRVKIGFQVVLKLLRVGATVVVTSRFPVDTARRIAAAGAAEGAAEDWASRCEVHGLDLRDVQGLSDFIVWMQRRFDRLDILVNNATQVRKRHFCAILY